MNSRIVYSSYSAAVRASADALRPAIAVSGDSFELLKRMPDNSVDLIFSSPPYCMGKQYENTSDLKVFVKQHKILLPELTRVLKNGGSLCWQTGNHVQKGVVTPLDALIISEMTTIPNMRLRNRVIWAVGNGLHCNNRFSGRHETILWYTKGDVYDFNLDAVRVPQRYPGKTYSKGPKKGQLSGNPLGKNPGDVWEIPNVQANHVEKTSHPCQFPVALPQIFIKSLTRTGDLVFDPFMGSGSTGVAALIEGRRFLGSDIEPEYIAIAERRLRNALQGSEAVRPWNQKIYEPDPNTKVARRPEHFAKPSSQFQIKSL